MHAARRRAASFGVGGNTNEEAFFEKFMHHVGRAWLVEKAYNNNRRRRRVSSCIIVDDDQKNHSLQQCGGGGARSFACAAAAALNYTLSFGPRTTTPRSLA